MFPHLRLRDVTPRGFYARSLLIVLLPLVILLTVMTWFFFDNHIAEVSRKLSQTIAGDVSVVRTLLTDASTEEEKSRRLEQISNTLKMVVSIDPDAALPPPPERPFWTKSRDAILAHELKVALAPAEFWFDTNAPESQVDIRVKSDIGIIHILVDRKRTFATTGHIFIVWVIGFSLLLIFVTMGFLRNQVRSVLKLSAAAEAWGRGEDIGDLKPTGATEVRQAARAISQMRERIIAHVDQRTAMLAGVSHDLRTPLTRLKLQLALLPDTPDKHAARKDLDEMQAMLDAYLAFARGEEGEAYERVDLAGITREVAMSVADRVQVDLKFGEETQLRLRPLAVKRALANLINNAADHADHIQITLNQTNAAFDIIIDDNGPGIAENQIEDAFKPFSRLDPSRNQNKSGVGLGLALARDIARSHGGDVKLGKSPLGGLRAIFNLPRQLANLDEY